MLSGLRGIGLLEVLRLMGKSVFDARYPVTDRRLFAFTSRIRFPMPRPFFQKPLSALPPCPASAPAYQHPTKLILHLAQHRTAFVHITAAVQCSADTIQVCEQLVRCLLRDFSRIRY